MTIDIRPSAGITADWLTAVLRHAGHAVDVADFTAQRIGSGQVGESVRFSLKYTGLATGAPAAIVGKFPSTDETSRQTGIMFGNYIREVNFYRHLAPTALIRTPRCLFTDINEDTHDFVLMMEDLAPAEQGDQTMGVSLHQARLAMAEAAKLHSSHWNDRALDDHTWLSGARVAAQGPGGELMTSLWAGFLNRYGARVSPECRRVGGVFVALYDTYQHGYAVPKCLTHNDFRPDNMMFATSAGGAPATIVDWQTAGYGCPMADISYFLGGAFTRDQRQAHERGLLNLYHTGLQSLGVTDYDGDSLWRDYAR